MSRQHYFDPISQFCRACRMPRRMLADDPRLEACNEENARIWKAREAREDAARAVLARKIEISNQIDLQPLPVGTTWGDIRRAAGIARWPA